MRHPPTYAIFKLNFLDMTKKHIITSLACLSAVWAGAQRPFKCSLHDLENKINLHIDLYEESINVPGMEMFGPMNGYMNGNVYGIWMVTSCKVEDEKTATLRLSNDLGSETQQVRLTVENDSTYQFEQEDGAVIKKVVNRKLVKIPKKLTFTRQK